MSCNGCRILRKGCNDNCILRQCFRGIEGPEAQANATLFLAKFFGRANLMSFIYAVPESQRPSLFQSLLFEACGRTINKVNGAVGLLWTGNWQVCQSAVETVLRGGALCQMPLIDNGGSLASERNINLFKPHEVWEERNQVSRSLAQAKNDVHLVFTSSLPTIVMTGGRTKRHAETPEESETTTYESGSGCSNRSLQGQGERKLLKLFI